MKASRHVDIAVIGAGIVGIACAYYLARSTKAPRIALLDPLAPMSLTSAASGENYRNWWPHPVMTAFTDHSIDLMEAIARESGNRLHMTRRGYALATRQAKPDALLSDLHRGYSDGGARRIRTHAPGGSTRYVPASAADWQAAPDGVDIIQDRAILDRHFPTYDKSVETVLHIRRAGDISAQQLGSYMLEHIRQRGGVLLKGRVTALARATGFAVAATGDDGPFSLSSDLVVDAAGPFVADVAAFLGEELPVLNVFQQKIAFEDALGAIRRDMPFSIDLDRQVIDWTDEERDLLAGDPDTRWLAGEMPGAIHCRPEGGEHGKWLKLGWAFNTTPSAPSERLPFHPNFPEIVLHGASRLNPGLKAYYGRLPARTSHYGGYYTMTRENWPLIGPMKTPGAFVAGALSGFGTMAACATGSLCASWILGQPLPAFAHALSLARQADSALMQSLLEVEGAGIL